MTCLAVPYISTLSHKRHDFREEGGGGGGITEPKMCVLIFATNFRPETFLILTIIRRNNIINVQKSSCKVPVILVGF